MSERMWRIVSFLVPAAFIFLIAMSIFSLVRGGPLCMWRRIARFLDVLLGLIFILFLVGGISSLFRGHQHEDDYRGYL